MTPQTSRTPLAELAFYSKDEAGNEHKLAGSHIAHKIEKDRIEYAFDNNPETVASTKSTKYWIGTDLGEGKAARVTKIMFLPKSDANNVEPGHLYELYYFNRGWHLAGRKIAKEYKLVFNNIPSGVILLLKDRTKGHEERISEYSEGRQIWY